MNEKKKWAIFFLIIFIVMILAMLSITTRTSGNDIVYATYIVKPGDTIWDIATKNCPKNMDIREWIYKVREINRVDFLIHPGHEMKILKEGS